ncbi:MAG: ABC transporter permease, partial [Bacteroidota bacterium]
MFKNYLKIAWRNLLKNKGYSIINIGGLALGMAVTLIIGLWIHDEITYNTYFKNKDTFAQVFQSQTFNGNVGTGPAIPLPLEPALRDGYSDNFKHIMMSSWTQDSYIKYGEKSISRPGNYMQPIAPDLLNLEIIKGERDGLREINSIMLSKSTADALFGDQDPIGKVVKISNQYDLMVTAVYTDIPFNNAFNDTDYIIPWKNYVANREWIQESLDNWQNNSFQMFVQIQ